MNMKVNWSIERVKDQDTKCWIPMDSSDPDYDSIPDADPKKNRKLTMVTEALIWASMTIGLKEIKGNNINEWIFRTKCIEMLGLKFMQDHSGKLISFTVKDLEDHIGLYTSIPHQTRNKFLETFASKIEDHLKRNGHFKGAPRKSKVMAAIDAANDT